MAIKNLLDFRGGYANSLPADLMADNELRRAENCTWKDGLVKRNGALTYSTSDFSALVGMKGGIRAFINETWYTIIAVDDDSYVRILAGTGTTFTEIDATFTLTKATNVEFAELLGHVVGVNGTDKPFVVYWDSVLVVKNLEAYDERTRENVNWFAGQYEDSLVVGYQECGLSAKTSTTETGLTASSYGYQECGLSGKTSTTDTGLTTMTQYYFKLNVDGDGEVEYSITTAGTALYSSVIGLMNAAISGAGALFSLVGGDLRCTSQLLGAGSSIALAAGTTGTDLFASLTDFSDFDSAVAGATGVYYYKINIDGEGEVEYSITLGTDSTYAAVMILMNANHPAAYFSLVGGDLRCTSYLVGATSAIALAAGTTGTDLFGALTGFSTFDAAVAGEAGSHFVDDTADAQSDYDEDFQIGNNEQNDGCYVACDYTFNKVIFKRAVAAGGSPVAEYDYWNGTAWAAVTTVTEPTWTDATGDKTLEFNLPLDTDGSLLWETYSLDDSTENVQNKFILRVKFTTAASAAFSCTSLELYHTQYLTQVLQDERPHLVRMHNSQIYLASRNIVNFSPPFTVKGWREGQVEHFDEGGAKINDMVSFADMLVVGKERTIYTWTTSDLLDPVRSRPLTTIGPIANRTMKQIGNIISFVARDGIYVWDGNMVSRVSKHIRDDIDTYTLTNACAVVYRGEYWVSFPANGVTLVFDPDTYRTDDAGDGRVSFYKFTNYGYHQFIYCDGESDTGYLLAVKDQAIPYLARCDYGTQDNFGAAVNIDMRCQTKYFGFGNSLTPKWFGRLKVKVKEVSAHSGEKHKIVMYSNEDDTYEKLTFVVPKGTGYYVEDIRVPYTMDGNLLSVELRHNGPTLASLIEYSLETVDRSY